MLLYLFSRMNQHQFANNISIFISQKMESVWTVTSPSGFSLSVEFSRQEYWNGLPFPSAEDLPSPGIRPSLLHCRQILYTLSHWRNPKSVWEIFESVYWGEMNSGSRMRKSNLESHICHLCSVWLRSAQSSGVQFSYLWNDNIVPKNFLKTL